MVLNMIKGLDKKDKAILNIPLVKIFNKVLTAVMVRNGSYDSFIMEFDNCIFTISCYVKEEK